LFYVIPKPMRQYPVFSYLAALVISGIMLGAGFILYTMLGFNAGGGETLQDRESSALFKLILALIPAIVAIIIGQNFYARGKKAAAYGMSILPVILAIAHIFIYLLNFHYHTPLDTATWKNSEWKPLNMAATLAKEEKLLMGKTKQEIKVLLGEGQETLENSANIQNAVSYFVEEHWQLIIHFENDIVVRTEMRKPKPRI
jgi:putative effector of murein hydrolase LrgA (UPF0299 family)